MVTLLPHEFDLIQNVAKELKIDWRWLFNLIKFESGFNCSIKNPNPKSSARGLLQFVNSSARELGFKDSQDLIDKLYIFEMQMKDAVLPYLKKYMPFKSKQSLYMAVFYPAYRKVSPQTEFSENIRRMNPGIKIVQDYINKVDGIK